MWMENQMKIAIMKAMIMKSIVSKGYEYMRYINPVGIERKIIITNALKSGVGGGAVANLNIFGFFDIWVKFFAKVTIIYYLKI